MKKIYINIWDDFSGAEEETGGTTFAYVEQADGVSVPQEELVLHNIASMLATVKTEVKFKTYYQESEFGFSRWELVMNGVNLDTIDRIVQYFGQLQHTIFLNGETYGVEVYSES
ncbi:hypothetical protein ASwh1_55 [Aeromonas phage Aswh_1]|nr:hypothetical protein ASwh1_55 [Aeromonas phage Aswh_1]